MTNSANSSGRRKRPTRPNSRGGSDSRPKPTSTGAMKKPSKSAAAKNPSHSTIPKPPTKANGEKGAESHTVSETERIRFTKVLMKVRESEEQRVEFPSTLTNTERKFVHELAGRLGLVSKSSGKGENRRIAVYKRNEVIKQIQEDSLPLLRVGQRGTDALKRHLQRYPPTHTEQLESHETGAALVEALAQGNEDGETALESTLDQLGHELRQEAPPQEAPRKHINLVKRAAYHAQCQTRKRQHPQYHAMQQVRANLPIHAHKEEIVQTVQNHTVTIISGATGSGKSTGAPQAILDANPCASIVVTQPRRISAISIAERVAQEQCLEPVGGLVGYQVRLESAVSTHTQLLFLTPGVLLRKLQSSPLLAEFTHIVIDEIHERDKYTEFLLIALRNLIPKRPDLRIVLMSATLQTKKLVDYFSTSTDYDTLGHVELEGRTFPVQEFYLEKVLLMTGYMRDGVSYASDAAMRQLEADLAAHLNQSSSSKKVDGSLSCVMCGTGGFMDALELGEHVAFCDGGRGEDMDELDTRIREMNSTHVSTRGLVSTEHGESEDYDTEGAKDENKTSKWDGVSPFELSSIMPSGPTLPEEELLNQYQAMHDDDTIDFALVLEVLQYIIQSSHGDGAILVFLPGWQEISECSLMLEGTAPFSNCSRYLILPLHSGIPSKEQRRVLQRPPPGLRKIVLSTNISETSLTIEDIAFVVDTGKAKEKSYDPHLKTSTLQPTWISQASVKQRRGRAGRTKAGVCFHLFSSRRYASMRPFVESELLRTPLEEMCLLAKKLALAPGGPEDADGVPAFLAKAMSPPHPKSVENALELLVDLGAIEPETNSLTSLGHCLSVLSLEPRVGKMVIWSYLLGCARVAVNMGVAMSYKSPFVLPPPSMRRAADSAKVDLSQNTESDQLTILFALRKRDQLLRRPGGNCNDFCRRNFISASTIEMISDLRKNLTRELTSLGFPSPLSMNQSHNRHDNDQALWEAAIAAGLYANVASRRCGEVNFSTMTNRKAKIHISSVNSIRGQPLNAKCSIPEGEVEYVAFGEMVKGTNFFTMSQTTHLSSPLPLLLLCGTSLSVRPVPEDSKNAILNMDEWIVFRCNADTASHVVILRKRLETAFWHLLSNPSTGLSTLSSAERDAVEILGTVLQSAHCPAYER